MSAVLSHAPAHSDVGARLAFQKQLQAVTNKIHATNNIDEIMLEVSADVCALFHADRLTIYSMGEDRQSIVSKVKTGLNSFKDLKLPIAEHSIAGYVALAKKTANIKDVYDENELRALNANLRFLQEVDKRTGYRTKQMLVAPILEAGSNELIGVIQIINNKAGVPFAALAEEGVGELSQTLAIAFKQRQKPQVAKTKYDYLIADAVLSAGEFELATRQARKKAIDIEQVLIDEFQVKIPAIGAALSKFFSVPYEPFKSDRVKPAELLKNLKREYVESNQWVPIDDTKEGLVVVCLDPERIRSSRIASNVFPKARIVYKVATQKDFKETVNQFYGAETAGGQDMGNVEDLLGAMGDDPTEVLDGGAADEASAAADNELVKLVNKVIVDAYNQGASDIHIEPYPGKAKTEIRLRKDGSLGTYIEVPASYRSAIVARIKIMCDLDISEKRKPQDGKIKFKKFGPLDIELRVATIPTAGGVEDIVMRILAAGEPIPLEKMGFTDRNLEQVKATVSKPYGLFFVCGPTGSGQDHHSAFGAQVPQHPRHQDLDRRGPGRNHAKGPAPGAGEQEGRPRLRRHHEGVPARRPGHHHGRRDARQGDHRHRHRGLAHRPPGVRHPAHQLGAGIDHAPARHGHGPVQLLRRAARHPGAAPGEAPVQLQADLHPRVRRAHRVPARVLRGADGHLALQGGPEGRHGGGVQGLGPGLRQRQGPAHLLQAGGLRQVRRLGLQGPLRPARAPDRERPAEEGDPGACAGRRDARHLPRGGHAHPQAGRHGEMPDGRHPHEGSASRLCQVETLHEPC